MVGCRNTRPRMQIVGTTGLKSRTQETPAWSHLGQISLAALTFTILWPTFNLCFLMLIQLELGELNPGLLAGTALKLYVVFTTAYFIIRTLQRRFPVALAPTRLWNQLILHLVVIGSCCGRTDFNALSGFWSTRRVVSRSLWHRQLRRADRTARNRLATD